MLRVDLPPLEHAKSGALSQSTTSQASHTVVYHTAFRPTSPVCISSGTSHMRNVALVYTQAKKKYAHNNMAAAACAPSVMSWHHVQIVDRPPQAMAPPLPPADITVDSQCCFWLVVLKIRSAMLKPACLTRPPGLSVASSTRTSL